MIKLLKKYVLIKNSKKEVTKSGIILASKNEVKNQGIIEELGPDCPKELKKGQTVIYKENNIQKYNILNDDCVIIDSDDIVAIVE